MPLFCNKCESRRYPQYSESDNGTLWLCNKCQNFANSDDEIIREQTEQERADVRAKSEEFDRTSNFPVEHRSRRKGVN